jgi:hypothetical protein
MNIEDQLDAQRELYKRQYQDLSERLSGLETLVNEVASLIESTSSASNLTEVTPGFSLDLSSIQQVSLTQSNENRQALVNWQPVSSETAIAVLEVLKKEAP